METLPENQLMQAIRAGNEEAFAHFFNTHWEYLYREAYFRLKNHDDAQDLVQEIFTSFWQNRETVTIQVSIKAYLAGALKNKVIRHYTKSNLHQETVNHLLRQMTVFEEGVLDAITAKEIQHTVQQAIHHFPKNMRDIMLLRMQNFTIAEIAEALGLSTQTVKNNTTIALKQLKDILIKKHPEVSTSLYASILALTNI
ncbi:sigma-70 family RNA polymerase sigma factor [Sphingobacterium sp. lm-10]|uniref:RNA polymerase sigma factor n=1 Tax=Sphingobacterium sp. lm-10 TaxID=2944904 RepID=UPI0020207177|nr:sigma-70 family RNA polymerase sigma factor [Sphingobacterium sp. lm-10]MCL7986618.1 sigma-70 family RNA polymerase sigma factor [Sphingobacterium sp. lm-10]